MIYYNGQIINPEKFRVPNYNISPFSTESLVHLDAILKTEKSSDRLINKKFGFYEFEFSGKAAIEKALSFYDLNYDDEIWIVTSTSNIYVSSCVTLEIEKYCRWSRQYSENTKVIFVIHEFGLIYPEMNELTKLNIPIIEDLAMSMFSQNREDKAGRYGDFAIYSLPKFFPIQYGGILSYNNLEFYNNKPKLVKPFINDLKKVTEYYLIQEKEIVDKRKFNYLCFEGLFKLLGVSSRLVLNDYEVPSVYMFSSDHLDLDKLKIFMQQNGVECSKFYGEESFFLPIHQNLNDFDIHYIFNMIKFFYENK